MDIRILFPGNREIGYRDPACIYAEGQYHLFMTRSERTPDGYLYNTLAVSHGRTLDTMTEPVSITERDRTKNYCSPGCVLPVGDEYWIPVSSYPMPQPFAERPYATEDARLFVVRTRDFEHYSDPELLLPKGDTPPEALGRMIDPYLLRDKAGLYHLFFKQNGVSHSVSRDLRHWEFLGRMDGGENVSVYEKDGVYHLYHSPETGIGHKITADWEHWEDLGVSTLGQERLDFATGRLTAGFFMEAAPQEAHPYLMFFHGSRADCLPETHGAATLAVAYLDSTDLPGAQR